MLASDLEDQGFEVRVSHLTAAGIGAVHGAVAALAPSSSKSSGYEDVDLIFVHAETPRDVIQSLRHGPANRICLFGPFAGERFNETQADFAFVGPVRDEPIRLAQSFATENPSELWRTIPRLLYRDGEVSASSEIWSLPRFEDWSRVRSHPRRGALSVPSSLLPEAPRVGLLTLPSSRSDDSDRSLFASTERSRLPSARSGIAPAVDERIRAHAYSDRDELWLSWAPRESHPNDLLDRSFSLLWDEGVRHFRFICASPFSAWSQWFEHLRRLDTLPKEVEFSPSVDSLRAAQSGLDGLLATATRLGIRIVFSEIPFLSFVDRSARLYGVTRSHWETRAVARMLRQLDGRHGEHDLLSGGHRLSLFDPWTSIEDLLDELQAIDEDAPFLKDNIDLDSSLLIRSQNSTVAERADRDSLLDRREGGTGLCFRFADTRVEQFRSLYPSGLVPLFEAVGRMRLDGEVHDETMIEARFRWARELALSLQESPGEEGPAAWGRIVARVVQSLQVDRPRSTR